MRTPIEVAEECCKTRDHKEHHDLYGWIVEGIKDRDAEIVKELREAVKNDDLAFENLRKLIDKLSWVCAVSDTCLSKNCKHKKVRM
jgi:hypothetical protein